LVSALKSGKRVAIYGDYDADGVTSMAVLWHVLKAAAPESAIELFVPSRFEHGYGLNSDALRQLHAQGVQTIVTVDCGITAVEQARVARELGLELLITDHHTVEPSADGRVAIPDADAVAHPNLPGAPPAPFADLCGAAVAFKVASRFAVHWCGGERVADVLRDRLVATLPLVALGTVADVVPLVDENRIFAALGLGAMAKTSIPGLRALLDSSELNDGKVVNAEHVAFRLAPKLNAIGRVGHAAQAVELLTTADSARAAVIVKDLVEHNESRKQLERAIFDKACSLVESKGLHQPDVRAIALADAEWHEGVVGIVCSKIMERYGRPTVLAKLRDDGVAKGSGRSLDGFDLVSAVRSCSQHLVSCGGHAAAAGLTVKSGAWEAFAHEFTTRCTQSIAPEDLILSIRYDAIAEIGEMNAQAIKALDVLRPYGRGNREPSVLLRRAVVHLPPTLFGAAKNHLEVHLRPASGRPLRAIWWNGKPHLSALARASRLNLVVRPKIDEWRGGQSVLLEIQDAAIAD
jgi:single-stranded-DNA-specific exonuclease